jgi:hypothetical protein
MLFGSSTLEVLIGVLFLFLLLSLVVSAVAELIAQALALRSRTLYDAVSTMLFDEAARNAVFEHPIIKSLSQQNWFDKVRGNKSRPSYIPSDRFAQALLDVFQVRFDATGAIQITAPASVTLNAELEQLLASLARPLNGVVTDAERFGVEAAKWFDESMERVSGWYKRKTQVILFVVGAIVVVWANANVIRYAEALLINPTARAAVVSAAEAAVASPAPDASPAPGASPAASGAPAAAALSTEQTLAELKKLDFALGWDPAAGAKDPRHVPASLQEAIDAVGMNLLGWLLTIAALTMGAPFWFDTLKTVIGLRSTGPKPKAKATGQG